MKWNWTRGPASLLPGRIRNADGTFRSISGYAHELMHASLAAAAKEGHTRIPCEVTGCPSVSGELIENTDTKPVDVLLDAWKEQAGDESGKPAAERPIEPHRRYLYPAVPKYWSDWTFDSFEVDEDNREALDVAKAWAESPEGVLVFLGPTGTGKTHLAAAITDSLGRAGQDLSVWEFKSWLGALRDVFATNDRNEVKAFENRMIHAGVLVLDEVSAEATNDSHRDMFESVVNSRTGDRRPMLITTNANEESWQAWSQRAYSRLRHRDYATWILLMGRDHRRFAA